MNSQSDCIAALTTMRSELLRKIPQVTLRGSGAGSFLFAEHDQQSVEIYPSDDGGWIVEFWGASADEAVAQKVVRNPSDAVKAATDWCLQG
jgi:hypothetical protein